MVIPVVFAIALLWGVPWPVLVLLGAGVIHPGAAMGAAILVVALQVVPRKPAEPAWAVESRYHRAVASELRGGASLRLALVHAAERTPELGLAPALRRLGAGLPLGGVAPHLVRSFPRSGGHLAPALEFAGVAGGRSAEVFDRLAAVTADEADADRERVAATAQARLSAWVVGGLPIVAALYALMTGRIASLARIGGGGVVILAIGFGLLTTGLVAVTVIVRRAGS